MKSDIKVSNDKRTVEISKSSSQNYFHIRVNNDDGYMGAIVVTEEELEALQELIREAIELVNKRDW